MPVSTVRRNTKKTRNDIGYFESLFNALGPLKYHEINWAGQKYASADSAANSIRAVLNKKNMNNVHIRQAKDKVYLYSDEFFGVLPCETTLTLEDAFKRADICLRRFVSIEQWPIPIWLIPEYDGLTNFQIGMRIRDELKAYYPYLTVVPIGKSGFAIKRDKSYGNLCTNFENEGTVIETVPKTSVVIETLPKESVSVSYSSDVLEEMAVTNEDPVMTDIVNEPVSNIDEETPNEDILQKYSSADSAANSISAVLNNQKSKQVIVLPELPFEIAADVAKYLSTHGYSASMCVVPTDDNMYLATVTIVNS